MHGADDIGVHVMRRRSLQVVDLCLLQADWNIDLNV
jgi:hypothetical protein